MSKVHRQGSNQVNSPGGLKTAQGGFIVGGNKMVPDLPGPVSLLSRNEAQKKLIQYTDRQRNLYRKDIKKWRSAHKWAIDLYRPRRLKLTELYEDLILDTHWSSVMNARILRVLNSPFLLVDKDGQENEEATELITKQWFLDYMRLAMESIFHGYSLIGLDFQDSKVKDVFLIPRENVIPQWGKVLKDVYGDDDMVDYLEPPESHFYVGVGHPDDLGLLLKAAPLILLKKDTLSSWSRFQQIFGVPPRIAKAQTNDQELQNQVYNWLLNMTQNAVALVPEGFEFELFPQPSSTNVKEVFHLAAEYADGQLSKLVLHNTMTTDSGSSRSQSETHERKEEEVNKYDLLWMEHHINDELIPRLIRQGYPLEGLYGKFDRTAKLNQKEQLDIVNTLIEKGYVIDMDWISDNFNIPIIRKEAALYTAASAQESRDGGQQPQPKEETEEDDESDPAPSNKLKQEISRLYGSHQHPRNQSFSFSFPGLMLLIRKVYDGLLKPGDVDEDLHKAQYDKLKAAVGEGFQVDLNAIDSESLDGGLAEQFRRNVFVFSSFKNYHQIREMSQQLLDEDGAVRSFQEFAKVATQVHERYNLAWLEAEYEHAVGSGQMARKWQDIEEDDTLLRYDTAGDERVRPAHQALDRTTLPASHSFWRSYYPPNGWRCRCDATEVLRGRVTPDERIVYPEVEEMFRGNAGVDGVIFPKKHPYYDVAEADRKKADDNFGLTDPDKTE